MTTLMDSPARAVSSDKAQEAAFDQMVTLSPKRGLGAFLIVFWAVAVAVGAAWFLATPMGIFFLAGALVCLIVTVPVAFMKDYDVISPWTLIVAIAYLAFGTRGLFISLGVNGIRSIDQLYLLGQPPSFFVRPSVLFIGGFAGLTIGFMASPRTRRGVARSAKGRRDRLANDRFVSFVIVACAVIGFLAFILFARSTGGLSLSDISAKRTLLNGTYATSSYQSHGGYRFLANLSAIAFWLQLAKYSMEKVPHSFLHLRGWWLLALFLNAAALPIYASTRQEIVFVAASGLAIKFCLTRNGVPLRVVVAFGLAAVAIVVALSSLRAANSGNLGSVDLSGQSFLNSFVLTRTFADLPSTAQIMSAVPDQIPYAHGATVTAWVLAPIPRSVWPGKPVVSTAPEIASIVYGNARSGVPPGVVAEGFINFGAAGALGLPFLAGLLLGPLSRRWGGRAASSPTAAVLLSVVAMRTGPDLTSNGFGYAAFQLFEGLILLIPILRLITVRNDK